MRTCNTTVTTPTGVFTYHDSPVVTHCQAKVECARRNQILAPVTNWGDLNALLSVANDKDRNCRFHYGYHDYFVGLDVTVCDGVETRLFTNNQLWNHSEHGPMYRWTGSKTKDINVALYNPYYSTMVIAKNHIYKGYRFRFICLDPSNSTGSNAEPLKSAPSGQQLGSYPSFNVVLMVALLGVVVFLLASRKKDKKDICDLRKENELLKSQGC